MQVFYQVLILLLFMLCGLVAVKKNLMDLQGIRGLNALVLYFSQPCLILSGMQTDAEPELVRALMLVFVSAIVLMTLCGLAAYFFFFCKQPADRRAVLTNLSTVSNCGFMGYPVIVAALGQDALIYAVLFVAAFQFVLWMLCPLFFGGLQGLNVKKLLLNPSLIAVFLGMVLFLTGWRLPEFLGDGVTMMGNTTTPVAMFVIGARLCDLRLRHITDLGLLLACLLRLIVFPLCALFLLRLLSLPEMAVSSVYLYLAMPSAALTAIQADQYHSEAELASRGVALSTALSMATIPLMLLFIV